jgi:putative DNA primase/helicase
MTAASLRDAVDAAGLYLPNGHAAPPRQFLAVTLADFLARKLPPRRMLLEPIIPEQGLAMLFGPRGIAKTFVGLGIAYAVASGSAFLRWKATEPRRVLYIDGEMPAAAMQERLDWIVAGSEMQPPTDDLFQLITPDLQPDPMPDLTSEDGQSALAGHVEAADCIILDNLSTLCRAGKENEAESWLPMQEWMLGLRRAGKSVLLVHHAGKGGAQRGTSKREDILDTIISLRRPEDYRASEGARFEVHLEKARGISGEQAEPFEALLEVRDGAAFWTLRSLEDAELARVIALTEDGFRVRDIASELSMSMGKVNKLQKRAREAGHLSESPKRGGKGGRHFDGTVDND